LDLTEIVKKAENLYYRARNGSHDPNLGYYIPDLIKDLWKELEEFKKYSE